MGVVIHIDGGAGSGSGTGTGWDGQVEYRANLPITVGVPPIGSIYLVEKPTTFLGITTYQSGLYIKDSDTGSLSDWRRLNIAVTLYNSDGTLSSNRVVNGNSKNLTFNSLLTTQFNSETFSVLATAGATIQSSGIANATVETTGTGDVVLSTNTGNVKINSLNYPKFDGANGQVLKTNGTGTLSFGAITEGLKTKSGKVLNVTFTGNPKIATVTFATPFLDANYSVSLTVEGNRSFTPRVNNGRTAGTFIINMNANNIANLTSILWTATKHGEN